MKRSKTSTSRAQYLGCVPLGVCYIPSNSEVFAGRSGRRWTPIYPEPRDVLHTEKP